MPVADRKEAQTLDLKDPLAGWAEQFYTQPGCIYLDGNTLGLLSRSAETAVLETMQSWKQRAIDGWTKGPHPWFSLSREVGKLLAPLVGAKPESIALGDSVTVMLHQLLASFFQPATGRDKILIDELAFPTDRYAVESHLRLRRLKPSNHLALLRSQDGQTLDEEQLITALSSPGIALAVLPTVLYRSGQLLNIRRITQAARLAGVTVIWDCSHSVGVVPHQFAEDGIELAVGCTYKYLNGGPGAVAFTYVHPERLTAEPGLAGWFGSDPKWQFAMESEFHPAKDAGRFLLGTPHILSLAPLLGSLRIIEKAGIQAIRAKSLKLTRVLRNEVESKLSWAGVTCVTPKEDEHRGGHLTLRHRHVSQLSQALRSAGVVPDFRPPDLLRLAPAPLYTSFQQCVKAVNILAELIQSGEYLDMTKDEIVT